MRRALFVLSMVLGSACVPPTDDPSQVLDLRVLGVNFEPPELMAANCDALLKNDGGPVDITAFLAYAQPVAMSRPSPFGSRISHVIATGCA